MKNSPWNYYLALLIALLLAGCASRDDSLSRTNPYDPGGTNWKKNSNPRVTVSIDSLPLWYDYDHTAGTGTVEGAVRVMDNNGKYDSLRVTAWIGASVEAMDSIPVTNDSLWRFSGLVLGKKYFYKISAADSWDSVTTVTGSFTTPNGVPPALAESYSASASSSYITITWSQVKASILYNLYRSSSLNSGFSRILDTTLTAAMASISHIDYVADYRDYYYRIGAANEFGECKSKKTIWGYRYSTSVYAPSSISITGYSNYLYISWYNSYSYPRFYIHRSLSAAGPYYVVDSTSLSYYKDTLKSLDTAFYYCISSRNSSGQRSALSSYQYGSLTRLYGPSSISASDGAYASYIYISWSSVTGAAGYYIYRSTASSGAYTLAGQSKTINFNDSVATSDTYYYKVAAYDGNGRIGYLSSYSDYGYRQRLSYPSGISASNGTYSDCILISWTGVSTAGGYYIFRAKNTSLLDSMKLIDSTSKMFYYDSVKTGDTYYYSLVSYNGDGRQSAKSSPVSGYILRPAAPQMISATSSSYTDITVSWQPVTGAKGYYIYRAESSSGVYSIIDSTDTTVYQDTTAAPNQSTMQGKNYYYKVSAYTALGIQGTLSSYVSGYIKGLAAPSIIRLINYQYKNKIAMSWEKVPIATAYSVYRSISSAGAYTKIATVTDTFYTDDRLDSLTQCYYYKLASLYNSTESTQTGYFYGYRLIAPANFSVSPYTGYLYLSWTAFSDTNVMGYVLHRSSDSINYSAIGQFTRAVSSYRDSVTGLNKYYYRIHAYSRYDTSYARTMFGQRLPEPPANFAVSINADSATLTWDSVPGAVQYRIYLTYSSGSMSWDRNATLPRQYTQPGLTTGASYTFSIASINESGGKSVRSPIITVIPAGAPPPAPLSFSAIGQLYGITLNWLSSVNDIINGYYLYRSADSGKTYTAIDTVTGITYVDSVMGSRMYYYQVSAFNSAGEGPKSAVAMAQRQVPETPQNLALNGSLYSTHVPLIWSASSGAQGYYVYRATAAAGTYQKIKTVPTASCNDSSAVVSTVYYYKVSAYSPAGESALSEYVSGMRIPADGSVAAKKE
jgi:fibronectin type 3 domain-containing protein